MKRKRDLHDKDPNLSSKKKQKCHHFKLDLDKKGEFKRGPTIEDVIVTSMKDPQTVNNGWSIEMDDETPSLNETAEDSKPKTVIQQRLFGEEESDGGGSLGPSSLPGTYPHADTEMDNRVDPLNPGTPAPSTTPSPSQTPDYLTPTLLLLIFNITLPTFDLYKDITLLIRLSSDPHYWAWGIFLFAGIFLNFLFTCLAWWRLEPSQKKPWTWILLLLQVQDKILPPGLILLPAGVAPGQGSQGAGAHLEGGPLGQAGEGQAGQERWGAGTLPRGYAHCLGHCRNGVLQGGCQKVQQFHLIFSPQVQS